MKYIFSLILAIAAVILIVDIVEKGVMPEGSAVVTQVHGTARISSPRNPAGRQAKSNDAVSKDDRIEVDPNSRIELRLPDGGFMRLSENSRFTMGVVHFEKRTGTLDLQALLESGRVWAKMQKRASPGSSVEVITRAGRIGGKGSVYCAEADKDANATITVYEGLVSVLTASKDAARGAGRTSELGEVQPVGVEALRQVMVTAREGASQPKEIELKTAMNDWVRWNLQRDAREELQSITVGPASASITRGRALQLTAVAHYPDKSERDITSFATWSASPENVVKVDETGLAVGADVGTATLSAAIEDIQGSTALSVSREILSLKITPAAGSVMNGAVQQFKAIGTFSDRTVGDVSTAVVWKSSDPRIALVDATGRAVAGNLIGTAKITASMGSKQAGAVLKVKRELVSLTIMPDSAMVMPVETQRFGAIGHYSDGTTQDLTEEVDWESSDTSIALIEQAQAGRVVGRNKPGTAVIRASFKGKEATAKITVYTKDTLTTQ